MAAWFKREGKTTEAPDQGSSLLGTPDERVSSLLEFTPLPEQTAREVKESVSENKKREEPEDQTVSQELRVRPSAAPTILPVPKDPVVQEIESILSDDLTDIFLAMTPDEQRIFKEKGEETAIKITELLGAAHKNAKKILALIREWLRFIPAVNRFFLEQEAKIKTDKILATSFKPEDL